MEHPTRQWRKSIRICLAVTSILVLLSALFSVLSSTEKAVARSQESIQHEVKSQVAKVTANHWLTETVDRSGTWVPAMVLDQYQRPHLAYSCETGICYAVASGAQWITQTTGFYGTSESIVLDSLGHPHICFSVYGGGSPPRTVLYYAFFDGSVWRQETVDEYIGDKYGLGRNATMAWDDTGRLHIVYYGPDSLAWPPETDFRHAYYNGTKWVTETITGGAYGNGAGFSSGLIISPGNRMHALYGSFGTVKYAYFDGVSWHTQTVSHGIGGSLAMASDGSIHASFITDPSGGDNSYHLKYASLVDSGWVVEEVTRLITETVPAPLKVMGRSWPGATALQIDRFGRPAIAFFNTTDGSYAGYLRYAYRNGTEWIVETVDTQDGSGWGRLALALDSALHPRIAYYVAGGDQEVRYAQKSATPPPSLTINYDDGAPGSYFSLSGAYFPPNGAARVMVNGRILTDALPIDSTGSFVFRLATSQAGPGRYFVAVSVNPSLTVDFTLDASAPLRPLEGGGPILSVPGGIGFTRFVYLPLVRK